MTYILNSLVEFLILVIFFQFNFTYLQQEEYLYFIYNNHEHWMMWVTIVYVSIFSNAQ